MFRAVFACLGVGAVAVVGFAATRAPPVAPAAAAVAALASVTEPVARPVVRAAATAPVAPAAPAPSKAATSGASKVAVSGQAVPGRPLAGQQAPPGQQAPSGQQAPGAQQPLSLQFPTAAAAQARCPKDPVVWANARAKAYHVRGDKYYAKTRHGAYMCERDAIQRGFHTGLLPPKRDMIDTADANGSGGESQGGAGGGDKGLEFRLRNAQ